MKNIKIMVALVFLWASIGTVNANLWDGISYDFDIAHTNGKDYGLNGTARWTGNMYLEDSGLGPDTAHGVQWDRYKLINHGIWDSSGCVLPYEAPFWWYIRDNPLENDSADWPVIEPDPNSPPYMRIQIVNNSATEAAANRIGFIDHPTDGSIACVNSTYCRYNVSDTLYVKSGVYNISGTTYDSSIYWYLRAIQIYAGDMNYTIFYDQNTQDNFNEAYRGGDGIITRGWRIPATYEGELNCGATTTTTSTTSTTIAPICDACIRSSDGGDIIENATIEIVTMIDGIVFSDILETNESGQVCFEPYLGATYDVYMSKLPEYPETQIHSGINLCSEMVSKEYVVCDRESINETTFSFNITVHKGVYDIDFISNPSEIEIWECDDPSIIVNTEILNNIKFNPSCRDILSGASNEVNENGTLYTDSYVIETYPVLVNSVTSSVLFPEAVRNVFEKVTLNAAAGNSVNVDLYLQGDDEQIELCANLIDKCTNDLVNATTTVTWESKTLITNESRICINASDRNSNINYNIYHSEYYGENIDYIFGDVGTEINIELTKVGGSAGCFVTLGGTVKESVNEDPLPDIEMYIDCLAESTLTNGSGYYEFQNITVGDTCAVSSRSNGVYQDKTRQLQVNTNVTNFDFLLALEEEGTTGIQKFYTYEENIYAEKVHLRNVDVTVECREKDEIQTKETDRNGIAYFSNLIDTCRYSYTLDKTGYEIVKGNFKPNAVPIISNQMTPEGSFDCDISGIVYLENASIKEPISGVQINLYRTSGERIGQTFTNELGRYLLSGQCSTSYVIQAQTDRYGAVLKTQESIMTPSNEGGVVNTDLYLNLEETNTLSTYKRLVTFVLSLVGLIEIIIFFFVLMIFVKIINEM